MPSLDADVIVNGSSLAAYLVSLHRRTQLCDPGVTQVEIHLSKSAPFSSISPFQTLVVSEQGVTTLTGYVDSVLAEREDKIIILKGQDTYKLALEYFVHESLYTNNEAISYWIAYFCNLCGISYSNLGSGQSELVGIGVPIGLRSVSDALMALCAYARWCMRVTPAGVLTFQDTTQGSSADFTLTDVEEYEIDESDKDTRNVAKVWGGAGVQVSVERDSTVVPDRIMVFADPSIDTPAKATTLANAALDQYAGLNQEQQFKIIGNPNLRVGNLLAINPPDASYTGTLTHLEAILDQSGYTQNLALDRKCFRLPSFPITPAEFPCAECSQRFEVIYHPPTATQTTYTGLDVNAQGVFVGGKTNLSGYFSFVQRYDLSGNLVWEKFYSDLFVNNGRNFGIPLNILNIAVDDTYVYVVGFDILAADEGVRVKKLLIEDGSEVWNESTDWESVDTTGGICVNSTAVFTSGMYDVDDERGWFIERRSLIFGTRDWAVTIPNAQPDDNMFPYWTTCDETSIYVIGFDSYTTSFGDDRGQRVKVVRISLSGTILWTRLIEFDNLSTIAFSCALDSTGQNLYIYYWDGDSENFTIRRLYIVSGLDSGVQFDVPGYGPDSIAVGDEGVYRLYRAGAGSVTFDKYDLLTGVPQCSATFGLGNLGEVVQVYRGNVYAITHLLPNAYLGKWCA